MKFEIGQRVIYTSPGNPKIDFGFHVADMGQKDWVMHLNAKDENGKIKPITGTIKSITKDQNGDIYYGFAPDGWQPFSVASPTGFQAPEKHFKPLTDESLVLPGTIVRRDGSNRT